jgi:hypothetical protein
MTRKKNYPGIRKKLRGGALWSPSYFAGNCVALRLNHPPAHRATAEAALIV